MDFLLPKKISVQDQISIPNRSFENFPKKFDCSQRNALAIQQKVIELSCQYKALEGELSVLNKTIETLNEQIDLDQPCKK